MQEQYYKDRCTKLEQLVSELATKLFSADIEFIKKVLATLSDKPQQVEEPKKEANLPEQNILNEL